MGSMDSTIKKGDVVIEARDIVKNYGHLRALKGASLQVHAGEVTALLGDNGAGKSTMANIICGAIPKTSGQLFCRGEEIEVQSIQQAQELGIQVVYQDLALAPDLSVPYNIFLGREIIKDTFFGRMFRLLDRKKMTQISKEHLAELGIGLKSMTVPVKSLSGGERQALAVAKAVAWADSALIMDEPTAALGARQQALVYSTMRAAADKTLGVLVISHDIPKMLEVADRICIMRQGVVIANLIAKEAKLQTVLSLMLTGQA
ncbi:MAG: ATP-binding cassette domain-containing protein [Candidatus Pelethousia sp.]|nr:ATP-binding cassette domain-containing protein [Candidatus Pelethousia sp.]